MRRKEQKFHSNDTIDHDLKGGQHDIFNKHIKQLNKKL